jgi:hypothetical protein
MKTPEGATIHALRRVFDNGSWVGPKKELTCYVATIQKPMKRSSEKGDIIKLLDDFHGDGHYETTTNWTFPNGEVSTNLTGEPTPTDATGEYFDRLCNCEKGNQLQSMVDKIDQWGRNNRTVAQVFQVDSDLNAMFPPCMLDISALYRDGEVNLIAHFRSHTLAKSYYGDITALGRLQKWLSDQVGAEIGQLTVFSNSLHIRKKNDEHELAQRMLRELG